MNKFNKIFEKLAKVNDRSIVWNQFLDYCININLLNAKGQHYDFKGNEEHYAEMLGEWLNQLSTDLETEPYSDRLGMFYEELVTSHVKSKNLGQFYTPSEVTMLMNGLTVDENSSGMVNDCACGSARILLSAHVKSKGNLICIGQDLDEVSCKMAVLNFWSHGVRGSILQQNSLSLEWYKAWRVNNYLYHGLPIPHIEQVNEKEAYQFIGLKTNEIKPVEINKTQETVQSTLW